MYALEHNVSNIEQGLGHFIDQPLYHLISVFFLIEH